MFTRCFIICLKDLISSHKTPRIPHDHHQLKNAWLCMNAAFNVKYYLLLYENEEERINCNEESDLDR